MFKISCAFLKNKKKHSLLSLKEEPVNYTTSVVVVGFYRGKETALNRNLTGHSSLFHQFLAI